MSSEDILTQNDDIVLWKYGSRAIDQYKVATYEELRGKSAAATAAGFEPAT